MGGKAGALVTDDDATPVLVSGVPTPVSRAALTMLAVAVVCASVVFGFLDLFSNFREYDDEGYWLISTKLFLDGYVLYDQLSIPYGPVSLATKQFLHGALSIPVSNSAVRFVTLGYWILLSALSALLVLLTARSSTWGLVAFATVFIAMRAFTNEPGHPQELIACLVVLVPLVASRSYRSGSLMLWFLVGLILAAVMATKINIGLFCLAAILVVLASELRYSQGVAVLRVCAVVASALSPFVLMRAHLGQENCLLYAIITSAALTATAIALMNVRTATALGVRACMGLLTGVLTGLMLAAAYLMINGSSIGAMYESIRHFAGFLQTVVFFRSYTTWQLVLALLAPAFAIWIVLPGKRPGRENLILIGKTCFAALTAYALTADIHTNPQALLGWAGPWCWLCAMDSGRTLTARKLLAALACWHLLVAYPISGSQLYFGTFLIIVSALVCLADVAHWLASRCRLSVTRSLAPIAAAALFVFVFGKCIGLWYHYGSLQAIDLPGTKYIKIEPKKAELYRYLVTQMSESDVAFISSGFNSLFLWSGVQMPAPVIAQHNLLLLPEQARLDILRGLALANNPTVLMRLPMYGGELPKIELTEWIEAEFEIEQKRQGYLVMRRKAITPEPPSPKT